MSGRTFIQEVQRVDALGAFDRYDAERSADGEMMGAQTIDYIRDSGSLDALMVAQGVAMMQGEATLRGFLREIGAAIKESKP